MKKLWKDEKVVILGLSKTGEAVARYLNDEGASCVISEKRQPTEQDCLKIKNLEKAGITVEMSGNKEETINNADLIVTSPGISPNTDLIKGIRERKTPLISEPELAFIETSIPIIAVTGTNGKTTTTTLISEVFSKAEYNAPVCGNIGSPVISHISVDNDYLVAEISSFQLEYSPTFKPQIGVFLNYTADHVDWHGSEEEYKKVKTGFLKGQRSPLWTVLNACDPVLVDLSKKTKSEIYWFGKEMEGKCCYLSGNDIVIKEKGSQEKVLSVDELSIKGLHNYQNVMAAVATARLSGINIDTISQAAIEFKSVEHRLEFVNTINGVEFYNDSKATNCDATVCALKAFEDNKIVLIAGGKDKGTDLTELVGEINNHVNAVILLGEATERFASAINASGFSAISNVKTFEEAVEKALELNLGPVVLSPACASFDMFKNFEERGNVFKDIVNNKKKSLE